MASKRVLEYPPAVCVVCGAKRERGGPRTAHYACGGRMRVWWCITFGEWTFRGHCGREKEGSE